MRGERVELGHQQRLVAARVTDGGREEAEIVSLNDAESEKRGYRISLALRPLGPPPLPRPRSGSSSLEPLLLLPLLLLLALLLSLAPLELPDDVVAISVRSLGDAEPPAKIAARAARDRGSHPALAHVACAA